MTLRLTFDGKQSARTILTVVDIPDLSKAFYEANPFDSSQINPPLGSGPYKVGRVAPGQTIEYERVADYWGRDLPVNRGHNNFDRIRIEFYRDRQAAFEAFKKGDILYRAGIHLAHLGDRLRFSGARRRQGGQARISRREAAVDAGDRDQPAPRALPAIRACAGRSRCASISNGRSAILFYGAYERSQSCFERSDYKAEGLPSPEELALLEPLRDELPPEVFGEAVTQPASDGSGRDRKLLAQASKLLGEAGWKRQGNLLVNDKGERLAVEISGRGRRLRPRLSPWVENMRAIGIDASIRQVDSAQYAGPASEISTST